MPHPQTAGRVIDGEAVLMMADNSQIKVLNEVGSRIFELSDGEHTVSKIVDQIVAEYDVSSAEAREDVHTFLQQMVTDGIMVLSKTEGNAS